jgi:hypothetical protein
MLVTILDLLLTSIIAVDTLGLVVASRKGNASTEDMRRNCLIWTCFIVLNALSCDCWYLGTLLSLLGLVVKVWISVPRLGGADKLHQMIVNGTLSNYVKAIVDVINAKLEKVKTN